MKINKLIAAKLATLKLKKSVVAKEIGIDPAHFRRMLKGTSRIYPEILENLEPILNIQLIAKDVGGILNNQAQVVIQNASRFKTFHKDFSKNNYLPVPRLSDKAAAGSPAEINERDIIGYGLIFSDKEWVPGDPENYTCVEISGKSMYPIIDEGDIVAIDHNQRDARKLNNKIVAFRKDGGVTIKWLKVLDIKTVVGVPQNTDEKHDTAITLIGDEIENGIVGRVAWWWAKR